MHGSLRRYAVTIPAYTVTTRFTVECVGVSPSSLLIFFGGEPSLDGFGSTLVSYVPPVCGTLFTSTVLAAPNFNMLRMS